MAVSTSLNPDQAEIRSIQRASFTDSRYDASHAFSCESFQGPTSSSLVHGPEQGRCMYNVKDLWS